MAISRHELLEQCIERDEPVHPPEVTLTDFQEYLAIVLPLLQAVNRGVKLNFRGV